MKKHLLLACASAICTLTAAALSPIDERVTEVSGAYVRALDDVNFGNEDLNQRNNVVVTHSENFPGGGPSVYTTEYYFHIFTDKDNQRHRRLYLIRDTQQIGAMRYACDYLVDEPTGRLMYIRATEPDLMGSGDCDMLNTQVFFDKKKPGKPVRKIVNSVSTDSPALDADLDRRIKTFQCLANTFANIRPEPRN